MAAALFFSRQWLVARIEKGVQHGFDSRLEAIRAELRASEERLKSTLRDRENEIALLRNTVLAGSASRQPLLDKRRFEAVERVWTAVNNMAGHFRLLSEFMARMNIDEVAKDVGDPRMKRVLSMFSPPDMTEFKNVARHERPLLPELACVMRTKADVRQRLSFYGSRPYPSRCAVPATNQPDGQIFAFAVGQITFRTHAILSPRKGRWPSSPNVGMGCGGRGGVEREVCSQGGFRERATARRTYDAEAYGEVVWS